MLLIARRARPNPYTSLPSPQRGNHAPHRPALAEAMQKATMILSPEFIRGI